MLSVFRTHPETVRYTLFGVAFGCCFPLGAWVMDMWVFHDLPMSWVGLMEVHMQNKLHFIIDTAPIFLGLAFGLAGAKQDVVQRINQGLEDKVAERTAALNQTYNQLVVSEEELRQNFEELRTMQEKLVEQHSELLQGEQELHSIKDFYARVIDFVPGELVVLDRHFRYVLINKLAVKNDEIRAWLIGKDDFEYCAYRQRPVSIAEKRREKLVVAQTTKQLVKWEESLPSGTGESIYYVRNLAPLLDVDGEVAYYIGFGLDVTWRKKAEEALEEAHEIAKMGTYEVNFKDNTAYWSLRTFEIYGLPPKPFAPSGTEYASLIHPEDRTLITAPMEKMTTTGQEVEISFRIIRPDGEIRYLYTKNKPALFENGRLIAFRGVVLDMTEQKQAEAKILEQSKILDGILRHMPVIMYKADRHYKFTSSQGSGLERLGLLPDQVVGYSLLDLYGQFKTYFDAAYKGQYISYEAQVGALDYTNFVFPDPSSSGGIIGFALDTTERRQAERMLEKTLDENNRLLHSLTDSIAYAQRIQQAMLPQEEEMQRAFEDYFVYFKPRDGVSGDFYWMARQDNKFILACADCTGHGIPGAFLSMVAMNQLNQLVTNLGIVSPDLILQELHKGFRAALRHEQTDVNDGLNIAVCTISQVDPDHQDIAGHTTILFAGAMHSLWAVTGSALQEFKGDRLPIGGHAVVEDDTQGSDRQFRLQRLDVWQPTRLYMFSDGYKDQFGGPENKKFGLVRLRNQILENSHLPMHQQGKLVERCMREWMGLYRQMDDMLVIGVQVF